MNFSEARDPSGIIFQILWASLRNYGLWVNCKETKGPLCKILEITDFRIYSGIEKFMDWVHGSWTGGAPGSTMDPSGMSTEAVVAHDRRTVRRAWGRGEGCTGGAGEAEQLRARLGYVSPRRTRWWRGDAMRPETAMAAAPRRWRCKRLGVEESEGEGVGNDSERRGPFIVAREGQAGGRKGEMAGGNGLNTIEIRAA
jgi:hypothetical protein